MKRKQAIDKGPGGMMILRLLIGAIIPTILPHLATTLFSKIHSLVDS